MPHVSSYVPTPPCTSPCLCVPAMPTLMPSCPFTLLTPIYSSPMPLCSLYTPFYAPCLLCPVSPFTTIPPLSCAPLCPYTSTCPPCIPTPMSPMNTYGPYTPMPSLCPCASMLHDSYLHKRQIFSTSLLRFVLPP